jgi:hypothetical protein
MAKLECFAIRGVELWFYSNDHSPPHFHAKRKGHWEVGVNFLESSTGRMFRVVSKGKGVPRDFTRRLEKLVGEHRADLLEEWERKVNLQ